MKYFITTTLPYINSTPHVGHALELILADTFANLYRRFGFEVHFNTGVDEHGLKIQRASSGSDISSIDYCNQFADLWGNTLVIFHVTPDTFYRTTSEEHKRKVIDVWNLFLSKDLLYKKKYTGKYCEGCESFKTSKDLIDGKCIDHPHLNIQEVEEENWFFKISEIKTELLDIAQQGWIIPSQRVNELLPIIEAAEDISVSRNSKVLKWGIPVPKDDTQTIYVWTDALLNYIFAAGYPENLNWEKSIQLCGPDNLRFQAHLWQGMLYYLNIRRTDKLLIHGTVLDKDGKKMSKSLGNGTDPVEIIHKYGLSSFRWYLISQHTTKDIFWNELDLITCYNSSLANGIGNLTSRLLKLQEGLIISSVIEEDLQFEFDTESDLKKLDLSNIIFRFNKKVTEINTSLTVLEPWKKNIDEKRKIVYTLWNQTKQCLNLLKSLLPNEKERIQSALDKTLKEPLFPRIK